MPTKPASPGRKHAEGGRGLLNEPLTDDLLRPLDLAAAEIADVVAFLETLTEKGPALPAPAADPCALSAK